jgi:hypothetical protein
VWNIVLCVLLYLTKHVRPDALCATIFLTTRVQNPNVDDLRKFYNVLEYLRSSDNIGICLGGDANGNLKVTTFSDAAFNVHDGANHTVVILCP